MAGLWNGNTLRKKVLDGVKKQRTIIVFDTETTGLSPQKGDRVIELSARKYKWNQTMQDFELLDVFEQYFKPPFMVEPEIESLTGITNQFLENKPGFEQVASSVANFFGTGALLVGHHVKFDIQFLESEFEKSGLAFRYFDAIDTLQMARERIPKSDIENHKLFTVLHYLHLDKGLTAHQAKDDAQATFRIFRHFFFEYIEEEKTETNRSLNLERPKVCSVEFWKGFRGMSRIYVNLSGGDAIFYDVRNYGWGSKDLDLEKIDMDYIMMQAFTLTGSADLKEFSKFKNRAFA